MIETQRYRIEGGRVVCLADYSTRDDGGLDKSDASNAFDRHIERLILHQQKLYAQHRHALLVVFQAMDAGGKDSTIRHVFGPINPQGCHVASFKAPSQEEADHDYLWRIHHHTPRKGMIAVFNRSHYESVLVERVRQLVPEGRWMKRYDHINDFEKLLHDEGTTILKFFLHISKDYQRKQFQDRLDDPQKHWKFNPADLAERLRWDQYMAAFEDALGRCSTPHAPWYIVPAERKWFRNLLVAQVVDETLDQLGLAFPDSDFDASTIRID